MLIRAAEIAEAPSELRQHGLNPNGRRHQLSLGDLVGLQNSGVSDGWGGGVDWLGLWQEAGC